MSEMCEGVWPEIHKAVHSEFNEFFLPTYHITCSHIGSDFRLCLCCGSEEIAQSTLTMAPGNAGWFIMSRKEVKEEERGKGLGLALHKFALQVLRVAGVELVTCTVREDNKAQVRLLEKAEVWKVASVWKGKILFVCEL